MKYILIPPISIFRVLSKVQFPPTPKSPWTRLALLDLFPLLQLLGEVIGHQLGDFLSGLEMLDKVGRVREWEGQPKPNHSSDFKFNLKL